MIKILINKQEDYDKYVKQYYDEKYSISVIDSRGQTNLFCIFKPLSFPCILISGDVEYGFSKVHLCFMVIYENDFYDYTNAYENYKLKVKISSDANDRNIISSKPSTDCVGMSEIIIGDDFTYGEFVDKCKKDENFKTKWLK